MRRPRLVDSNILFSLLVGSSPWHGAARALHAEGDDWRTEAHALVELSNILARYVRVRELTGVQAVGLMSEAERQMAPTLLHVGPVPALQMAMKYKVSAYDARFLCCAVDLGTRLVTEDVKLRKAAPRLTSSIDDALSRVG